MLVAQRQQGGALFLRRAGGVRGGGRVIRREDQDEA